ncbi:hypothetical protein ERJ75_001106100 [Trypanosoma vivax]|nr:hypothetical protein ERJ75_001106100 [Trypanosoma vivax]
MFASGTRVARRCPHEAARPLPDTPWAARLALSSAGCRRDLPLRGEGGRACVTAVESTPPGLAPDVKSVCARIPSPGRLCARQTLIVRHSPARHVASSASQLGAGSINIIAKKAPSARFRSAAFAAFSGDCGADNRGHFSSANAPTG